MYTIIYTSWMIGFLMDGRCKLQVQARIQQLLSKGGGVSEKWLDLPEGGGGVARGLSEGLE